VRKPVEQGLRDLKTLYDDLKKGDDYTDDVAKYLESSGNLLSKVEKDFRNSLENTVKGIGENADKDSIIKQLTDAVEGKIGETEASLKKTAGNQPISSFLEGRQNQMREVEAASSTQASSQKTIVEIVGGMKIEMTFTGDAAGFTQTQKEQMAKAFTEKFNSTDYKQYVANISTKQNPTKSDSQFNYPSSK
jgi:hypothetical protein